MNDARAQMLNAYLDGELDAEHARQLESRLCQDPALRRHLEELRRVRRLARAAFPAPARERSANASLRRARVRHVALGAVAAGILLAVGVSIGLGLQRPAEPHLLAHLPSGAQTIQPAHLDIVAPAGETRAVFHITSVEPARVRATLDAIEEMISAYARARRPLRLELVANAEGLHLLRADTSPARERIAQIQRDFGNIRFLACGKTIQRIELETGRVVPLLPDVETAPSALDQILLRLRGGWSYVRV